MHLAGPPSPIDTPVQEFLDQLSSDLGRAAASLATDSSPTEITERFTRAILASADTAGLMSTTEFPLGMLAYTTSRGQRSTREAFVDVAIHSLGEYPLLLELDRTAKTWSVEKLMHGVAWGHPAAWVYWGAPDRLRLHIPWQIPVIQVPLPDELERQLPPPCSDALRRRLPHWHEIPSRMIITPATHPVYDQAARERARVSEPLRAEAHRDRHERWQAEGRSRRAGPNRPGGSGTSRRTA